MADEVLGAKHDRYTIPWQRARSTRLTLLQALPSIGDPILLVFD
jgi:hypothetical protein